MNRKAHWERIYGEKNPGKVSWYQKEPLLSLDLIENAVPDKAAELIMYCGGGFRSVLTAEVAQRMGYTNVHSLIGGHKALVNAGWELESGE